ncbi:hypothetical protein ACOME3_005506 [Neoechinorhynchus agilis]
MNVIKVSVCGKKTRDLWQRNKKIDSNLKEATRFKGIRRILSSVWKCVGGDQWKEKGNDRLVDDQSSSIDCKRRMATSAICSHLDTNVNQISISCDVPMKNNAWQDLRVRWAKIVEETLKNDKFATVIFDGCSKEPEEPNEAQKSSLENCDTITFSVDSGMDRSNSVEIKDDFILSVRNIKTAEDTKEADLCYLHSI